MIRKLSWLSLSILMLMMSVAHAQTVEQLDIEVPPALVEVMGEDLTIKIGKATYQINAPSEEDQFIYHELDNEQRLSFNQNRVLFLTSLARALHTVKYGVGIGSIVKDHVSYHYGNLKKGVKNVWESFRTPSHDYRVEQEIWAARERAMSIQEEMQNDEEQVKLTLKERSEEAILATLKAMDQKLCWNQAPLMARSNEYGVMAAVGIVGLGGIRNGKGWGGSIDLGISVAYNRDQRSMVIQIFREFEKYKNTTMPAVSIGGTVVKVGGFIANQKNEYARKGSSFYPPSLPGFSSFSPDYFAGGFSSGLTIPPSPIGDMLTYTNSLNQKALIRISVSPMLKGFVRVHTGLGKDSLSFVLTPVQKAIESIRAYFTPKISCNTVFMP